MNLEYFPHFIRMNYPAIKDLTNEEIFEIGSAFKKYLQDKFSGKMDKLELIWNIDAKSIIMNQVKNSPFLVNGYSPALILHFEKFVKEGTKK